ncbi:LAQU0S01e02212g1_1 [Lachancea quebecensis]|uniref:E3 ubiquitin protein ligase n=1 Tax=Lachancea quebecensis TaxID=1654605 RepID=A0A0P1KLG5_9SACH|nr:LAQU0S01e02212g1_1 [Lachancea quebecensis]
MSEEPTPKKAKLDWGLTDPSEPLTRKDVIAFQKEALFRTINKHRCREKSLEKQLEVCGQQSAEIREQYASLYAMVTALANKILDLSKEDQEAQKLCNTILEGDGKEVLALAADFTVLVEKHISEDEPSARQSPGEASWNKQLHQLEAAKAELSAHNKQLRKEISAIREHYQDLIRRYDREDSDTVRRVFKLQDSLGEGNAKDATEASPANQSEVTNTATGDEKEEAVSKMEHELQIQDLNDQIELLKHTLKDLESWKASSGAEIARLRTEITSINSASEQTNRGIQNDREALLQKLDFTTKENAELTQANDLYLSKFQQMVQEKEIFTNKLSMEFQTAQDALKKHNAMLEKDLVRIRATRDELTSKIAIMENQKPKSEMLADLQKVLDLQKERIEKMENKSVEATNDAVMKELQDLERAFKELTQFAHKKYSDHISQESIVAKLTVEKTKADQKYFTAMRSKDSILIENKNLSKNLHKSNELINQLKEIERTLQSKVESLNKQIHLSQSNEKRLMESSKAVSLKIMDLTSELGKTKKVVETLQGERAKQIEQDARLESNIHSLQSQNSALKLQLSQAENKAKKLHKSLVSNGGDNSIIAEELDNFRTIVYCSLCSKNWKNTAIKNCGHVFCEECCKERLAARMRKCPTCNKPFGSADLLVVHL